MYLKLVKPLADFLVSFIVLVLCSPVIVVIAILLAVWNRGTPFFTQIRTAKNGRLFRIIKFKTMNDFRDIHGNLLPDHVRIHSLGRFIRKASLDELPQLINVLKGDMSLVGPRPLLPEYLPHYNEEQRMRLNVKPGITGWAQVNGRNSLSWQEKFSLDRWYVQHVSFRTDMAIILKTARSIFKGSGVNASSTETMPRFTGNK